MAARTARSSTVTGSSRCSCTHANRVCEQVGGVQDRQRLFDVLGLAPVTLWQQNQSTSESGGDLAPIVLADDVQAKIDAGGAAGRV